MLESAQKISRYTNNLNFDSFQKDDKTIDAVVRNFEIIGEAANRIDLEIVWSIIENDLALIIDRLERVHNILSLIICFCGYFRSK